MYIFPFQLAFPNAGNVGRILHSSGNKSRCRRHRQRCAKCNLRRKLVCFIRIRHRHVFFFSRQCYHESLDFQIHLFSGIQKFCLSILRFDNDRSIYRQPYFCENRQLCIFWLEHDAGHSLFANGSSYGIALRNRLQSPRL